MNNKHLENKFEIKDLGIIVDDNLRFSNHIIDKVNKANQIMGIIKMAMVYLNRHNFNLLYTSLVRQPLEYGNAVWSPFLKSDTILRENVQRGATRYVLDINKLEYQERLEALNLPARQYRRFRGKMIETYKITHGHFEDYCVKHLFEMKSTNTRGHQCAIKIKHSNTTTNRSYFAFRIASVWNSPSSGIVGSVFLNVFKKKLDDHCLTRNIVFDSNYEFLNTCVPEYLKYLIEVAFCYCFIHFQVYLCLLLDILHQK